MCTSFSLDLPFSEQTHSSHPDHFFHVVLESLADGVLILSDRGEPIHANQQASVLCEQILPDESHPHTVVREVWRLCRALIEGRDLFPEQQLTLESEVITADSTPLRLRVRWFEWIDCDRPCLLVTLENRSASLHNQALCDTQKYGLTPRETQVWSLRCAHHSYKEIAAKLYISENTVKKHMKNINAKRKAALWSEKDKDSNYQFA